jgi:hypothetical protein
MVLISIFLVISDDECFHASVAMGMFPFGHSSLLNAGKYKLYFDIFVSMRKFLQKVFVLSSCVVFPMNFTVGFGRVPLETLHLSLRVSENFPSMEGNAVLCIAIAFSLF